MGESSQPPQMLGFPRFDKADKEHKVLFWIASICGPRHVWLLHLAAKLSRVSVDVVKPCLTMFMSLRYLGRCPRFQDPDVTWS